MPRAPRRTATHDPVPAIHDPAQRRRPVSDRTSWPVRAATGLAAGGFAYLARLRNGKPIHTSGTVYGVRIRRYGAGRRWGVPWLDEPGEDLGVGRISRGVGLPAFLPDVLGLAVRFTGADGTRHDLLLSTTGIGRGVRHLLLPRRDPVRSTYSTVFPYRDGAGQPILLIAHPRCRAPGNPEIRFVLAAATPWTSWDRFGILTLTRPAGLTTPDAAVSFDPVRNPLPGLRLPDSLAAIRAAGYAGARHGRHAADRELRLTDPGDLTAT